MSQLVIWWRRALDAAGLWAVVAWPLACVFVGIGLWFASH